MTTSYNKRSRGARVGNWVEEEALRAATGTARYEEWVTDDMGDTRIVKSMGVDKKTDTNGRVMAHSDHIESKDFVSTTRDAHNPDKYAPGYVDRSGGLGPRAARIAAKLEEEATRPRPVIARETEWETTAGATFTQHVDTAYTEPKGRRVMRTIDGKDLPPGCRDEEFLAANSISLKTAKLTAEEAASMLPRGDYLGQAPVTLYSQRLGEGVFPASAATGANPFARSSAFTAELTDATRAHAEAVDDISGKPRGSKTSMVAAAGAELSAREVADIVRAKIIERGGDNGVRTLTRLLKRMDTSGDGKLSAPELQAGLADMGVALSPKEVMQVMALFDRDRSGKLTLRELQMALAGEMSDKRKAFVDEAFRRLDKTGDGEVTIEDIAAAYDASANPDVASGKVSEDEARAALLANFDITDRDGVVTRAEFHEYYAGLSAGIEHDDYWELMMRNAWHISGGEGWAENTSCLRVLVVHTDSSEEVVEITDDLGLRADDMPAIKARLRRQGVKNIAAVKLGM
uniref:EF-hand domain-containing protein n=1 Tax=Bicosoecida sp. CB-2014 TaxID=1486930 RepID=A0A7S1CF06_9STRA|mmetsp:Transcript_24545/g.85319  ORF Transcript_24545/g.85319 Transcript_24545/m.85319 type:complete len:517 (+) Transcript_24545:191-1741(+)